MTEDEQIEALRPHTERLLKETYARSVGVTDALREMTVGSKIILADMERPNIHSLAKRALRTVKVNKRLDGSFLVTCTGVLPDKGEVDIADGSADILGLG